MKSKILGSVKIKDLTRKYFIFLVLIGVFIAGKFSNPLFMTLRNQRNIMLDFSIPFILAIGLTMVILIGGIDLSIGSVISLTGVVAGILVPKTGVLFTIIIVLLMGMGIGALNGFFISRFKILPFIVTLSSMIIWEGMALIITKSMPVLITNPSFHAINYGSIFGGIPLPWLYSFSIFTLAFIFLNFHATGRRLYQIGNDEETARIAGVKVDKTKIGVYMLNSTIAAFCGLIVTARMKLGDPSVGADFLFDSIAAVCLGGTAIGGGQGGVVGTLGGVLLMLNLKNILILNDVSIYIQDVIRGAIILISIIILNIQNQNILGKK